MDLGTAVEVAGGRIAGLADLSGSLSADELGQTEYWITTLQDLADGYRAGAGSEPVSIVLTRSPSLALRTRPVDDGSIVVLVPIGLIVRIRVLATLLLGYPDDGFKIKVAASLLDDAPDGGWEIATRLGPVFGEYLDDGDHWQRLAGLIGAQARDADLDAALVNTTWASVTLVVLHELAHVMRGHLDALRRFDAGQLGPAVTLEHSQFRRGLELDADVSGAELFMSLLQVTEGERLTEPEYRSGVFFWTGFASTLLFGMYDTRRKTLGLYGNGLYPHPLIRHQIWGMASDRIVSQIMPEWFSDWQQAVRQGWTRCVEAFWSLDVDVFRGKFSDPPQQGFRCAPVTALHYSMFDAPFNEEQIQREIRLFESVQRILDNLRQGLAFRGDGAVDADLV